jgi:hypothetical protein
MPLHAARVLVRRSRRFWSCPPPGKHGLPGSPVWTVIHKILGNASSSERYVKFASCVRSWRKKRKNKETAPRHGRSRFGFGTRSRVPGFGHQQAAYQHGEMVALAAVAFRWALRRPADTSNQAGRRVESGGPTRRTTPMRVCVGSPRRLPECPTGHRSPAQAVTAPLRPSHCGERLPGLMYLSVFRSQQKKKRPRHGRSRFRSPGVVWRTTRLRSGRTGPEPLRSC